ncbi:DUF6493 family protein [Streptomonospora sediminis]
MNLLELAEAGDAAGVLRELESMTLEQRAAWIPELAAFRETLDTEDYVWKHSGQASALASAELGCRTTPEAAAAWLRGLRVSVVGSRCWMVDTVNLYPPEWRAELVVKLVEQGLPRTIWRDDGGVFALAEHLIRDTGCPIPTSNDFIHVWLCDRKGIARGGSRDRRAPNMLGGGRGAGFLERLCSDDFSAVLLPPALERPSFSIDRYRRVLVGVAAKGVLDRGLLSRRIFADLVRGTPAYADALKALEGHPLTATEQARIARTRQELAEPCISRLLQDGHREETAGPITTLRALDLTPDENASLFRDHVAMLDLSPPVASYGQDMLIGLDEAGLLEADVLTEACERTLLRPEKKLVRTQLSWLDKVARRDPARAGRVVVEAAAACQHPDVALQERALNLIARHLPNAGEEVLPDLRAAAGDINPGLAARAAELLGLPEDTAAEQYVEILPAMPEPRPVPGPVETIAEAAQEVAAAVANPGDVVAFERALDGLVRHARLDRDALSAALAPAVRREPRRFSGDWTQADLYEVAVALRGNESHGRHTFLLEDHAADQTFPKHWLITVAGDMLRARMSEVLKMIGSGTQPFLLAVPTLDTGALDAAVLVERIAEYERLDITPAPVDLAQALLRVDPAPGELVQRAAEKLESDAGRQLARWLGDGGLPHTDSTPKEWPVTDPTSAPPGWWCPANPGLPTKPPLPPVAAALVWEGRDRVAYEHAGPIWLAQMPHHRDEVAARIHADERRNSVPPYRVDAAGPAGYAIHWHIAYGLRSTADPFLVLAAQGRLDSALLAGQLQALLYRGVIEANRVTTTLRAAAETGAYATVWSVLEAALPPLLRDTPHRAAGSFLVLAVDCASRCGATGPIPEVDAVAARKGTTKTIKNARLLRDVLHREGTTP